MTQVRVKVKDLGFDWDMHHRLHNGELFTGIAYATHPNGQLASECEFADGVETGVTRAWYPSGRVRIEQQVWNFVIHGEAREWYENGQLKQWMKAKQGDVLEEKKWDPDGRLVSHYVMPDDHPFRKTIERHAPEAAPVPPPLRTGDH